MARQTGRMVAFDGPQGKIAGFLVRPDSSEPRPAVVVIHEIYGLGDHIKDVAGRVAEQGYAAFAPDLFARPPLADVMRPDVIADVFRLAAGAPRDRLTDPEFLSRTLAALPAEKREAARKVHALVFGGEMPREALARDLVAIVDHLGSHDFVRSGKIGSVGFCFGGGMSFALATSAPLAACAVFYGENPSPIESVARIPCPVLGIYGAEDVRINLRLDALVKAMAEHRKDFEMRIYPGAGHAFFNDTSPATYREGPAREAWDRLLRFYRRTLQEE